MKRLYILAGANGSGKSTIAKVLLPTEGVTYNMPEIVERMTRIGNKAVHAAQDENRRKGIANVYVLNGKTVWQLPDGTVTSVRPSA